MNSILPFDELNKFKIDLQERFPDKKLIINGNDFEDIIDWMLDLFLLAYARGVDITGERLGKPWKPTLDDVDKTVNKKVAGKTWRERTEEYFSNGGAVDDLIRIAETETHRDANEAALGTARNAGMKSKTWVTMLDEKVRDTHQYLEGMTVGIDEDFWTYDNDHAPAPGMFDYAENNVNCRCELLFS